MPNPEQIQYASRSQKAQELTNLVRDQLTKYRAGEIPRLPKRKELNEQVGYRSSVSFNRVLSRAGLLEEWRSTEEVRKIKQRKKGRTHIDASGINEGIPPILYGTGGRVAWRLPNNTPEENEQIGIHNVQGLFLRKFPEFNELFPRGEEGLIEESKREEAKKFILEKIGGLNECINIFKTSINNRKNAPYFNGSYKIVVQKSFSPWGINIAEDEFVLGRLKRSSHRDLSLSLDSETIPPSRELAWMIGVLAGGGYSNPNDKRISMDSDNEEFVRAFKSAGERLFGVNASVRTKKGEDNTKKLKGIVFQGKKITNTIGDLRGSEWPRTIVEQHKWIIENSNYLWSFIEGIFDRRGNVSMGKDSVRGVFIYSDYANVANFLAEILVRVGIRKPLIEHDKRGKQGIKGIRFENKQDLKYFADNIHSRIQGKEERLEACRQLTVGRRKRSVEVPVKTSKRITKEDAISEWIRIKTFLGHTPNSGEIERLKRDGGTKYSSSVYYRRFGEGKFSKARENIEKIVSARAFIDQVRQEALEFYNTHRRLSRKILKKLKRHNLLNAIDKYPGKIRQLKVDIGIETPDILIQQLGQRKFTNDQIEDEALKIHQREGKITKDVLERLGRQDLIWAIRKHYPGRYKGLRTKLELTKPATNQRVDKKPSGYWSIDQIEKEGREFYQQVGKLSHRSFKRNDRQDLLGAIRNHYPGGLSALKEKFGVFNEENATQETQIFP
ncbi:MAG: hypothetical protein A3D74_04620 [Candidatus Levybacteria bacterium RIFCSPHIGHO2_02_FULL_37_13]|nr:MAG: hypothetical protein A3D74_04620 [Candidatus Levybacteria bacterium RIFCSPHIGHO2_02_FULL_37_13]OGH29387.1 MAG: hypothetical protein A3E40_04615 [Candidatus Levybacteria bacterium RIFCSPHIGHO2_12_FULL_37_9]OGH39465.1 MAG: hypothetical protein A3B41_01135 [Candidatus Levybacteria bacterium RIFCSPLOWO2_01_FULL_37_26]